MQYTCSNTGAEENESYRFRPRRVRRVRNMSDPAPTISMSFEDSTDEEIRESGVGILEFSPAKAGQDVTPVNYHFSHVPPVAKERKQSSTGLATLAGMVM